MDEEGELFTSKIVKGPPKSIPEEKLNLLKTGVTPGITPTQIKKQAELRVKLSRVKPIPEEKKPPCKSCKTSACCTQFLVELTKEEYESGLYHPYTAKITAEQINQLSGLAGAFLKLKGGVVVPRTYYILGEGPGEPCPFLREDKGCGIYDHRPLVCRTYTCVGDDRINDGIREGLIPITSLLQKVINVTKQQV
jgi:Fe-S-cluster containining protein